VTEPDLSAGWRPIGDFTADRPADPQPEPAADTRLQRTLTGIVIAGVILIAALGFSGSYTAVSALAARKGFGWFAHAFPAGVDAGILVFLALDLLLTWRRIPYPMLRQVAWGLTAATIAFNAAAAWPDALAVGMHATIPVLFVVAVEAARHAVGRIAEITADRFIESPPLIRWLLSPISTFRIWRRMRLWQLRSYTDVIEREREAKVYRAKLRGRYGRSWRRSAQVHELLALKLARFGTSIEEALANHYDELVRTPEPAPVGTANPELESAASANREQAPTGSQEPVREPAPQPEPTTEPAPGSEPTTAEPAAANQRNRPPRTSGTANLGDRAAKKAAQIEQVLNLIDELGYDAATLTVVQNRTGMTKTTAHHRLKEARELWNQRAA